MKNRLNANTDSVRFAHASWLFNDAENPRSGFLTNGFLTLLLLLSMMMLFSSPGHAKELPDYAKLVEEQSAAVVRITAVTQVTPASANDSQPRFQGQEVPEMFTRFFEQMPQQPDGKRRPGAGFGSGFIVSEDGYVVTNAHVIDGADEIRVSLHDKREFDAEVIGADTRTDIALLKIGAEDLPVVTLGDSDDLRVGQWVLAIRV